jgi:predicted ATP-grasp superfamily ATP-dependent carboligase
MQNRVLILGDDMGVFLAVARSLGRRGVEVHVAPADADAPGLSSRYVSQVHPLPPYHAGQARWSRALRALIERHGYRLVVPCNDSRMMILRHHAGELGRSVLALPNDEALDVFTDKAATREAAVRAGIPVPPGITFVSSDDRTALPDALGLPLVIKPAVTYALGGRCEKVMAKIIRVPAQLREPLPGGEGGIWIAESYMPGAGVGLSVLARDGEVLTAFQHRRLAVASETGGSTVREAEAPDPRLLADARALAFQTRLTGVAMFEFRVDRLSGTYALLEVNPRFWGSLPLAVAAGADFPAMLWELLTQARVSPAPFPSVGLRKRSMTGELDRLAAFPRNGSVMGRMKLASTLLDLLIKTFHREHFDSWAADDERPFHVERHRVRQRLTVRIRTFIGRNDLLP